MLAQEAYYHAVKLREWCSDPSQLPATFTTFATQLVHELMSCFPATSLAQTAAREKMWSKYHELRTSADFHSKWKRLVKEGIGCEPTPILYQYITDKAFERLIEEHCTLPNKSICLQKPTLTYEERNALRYAAGYIPKALHKKIERSSHPIKKELLVCLEDITQHDGIRDDSQDWVQCIDRGGLKHVNSNMYMLLVAMEEEMQCTLRQQEIYQAELKKSVTENIATSDDVLFYWCLLSADWDAEEGEALLPLIIDIFVTMRGFAFASAWVEQNKMLQKKNTQKSKGIRKHLL